MFIRVQWCIQRHCLLSFQFLSLLFSSFSCSFDFASSFTALLPFTRDQFILHHLKIKFLVRNGFQPQYLQLAFLPHLAPLHLPSTRFTLTAGFSLFTIFHFEEVEILVDQVADHSLVHLQLPLFIKAQVNLENEFDPLFAFIHHLLITHLQNHLHLPLLAGINFRVLFQEVLFNLQGNCQDLTDIINRVAEGFHIFTLQLANHIHLNLAHHHPFLLPTLNHLNVDFHFYQRSQLIYFSFQFLMVLQGGEDH